jgi:GNAT superfamily N-acetyltransferase
VPPTLSDAAIFEEVVVTPRRAFPPMPDLRLIERPGWLQIITPSVKTGALNEVTYSALADADADAVIDATIAGYRALGLKFRWCVGPGSAPSDLGARLERRGLIASCGLGMARATAPLSGASTGSTAGDSAISIEEVDETTVEAFSRVIAEGWNLDHTPTAHVNHLILGTPQRRERLFLARCEDEPAAAASYIAFPRSAYLIGGVVLPRFRGLGLYRALVRARMADAHARGISLVTSHAREASSAPILAKLGFATICRFTRYHG